MPRLLSPLLVLLLKLWPVRTAARPRSLLAARPRGGLIPEVDPAADRALEALARSRARTTASHRWAGEVLITAGNRRTAVPGIWSFSHDPRHRARTLGDTPGLVLDPLDTAGWATQLTRLLTLQERGARLRVARADAAGWQTLEVRAPTSPETIVEVDRAAVDHLLGGDAQAVDVSFRVFV